MGGLMGGPIGGQMGGLIEGAGWGEIKTSVRPQLLIGPFYHFLTTVGHNLAARPDRGHGNQPAGCNW